MLQLPGNKISWEKRGKKIKIKKKERKKIRRESLCLSSESSVPNWFSFETMQQFVHLGQHLFSKQTSTKFAQGKLAYVWGKEVTSGEEDPGSLQCQVPLVLAESPSLLLSQD